MTEEPEITELLLAWKNGDEEAFESLIPLVEKELRRIASRQMRREKSNHTLQTTALINEAYLKLVKTSSINWQNRAHFFAVSAKVMRRILINYARDAKAQKRGGTAAELINLDEAVIFTEGKSQRLLDLDEALKRLETFDITKSQIVEMRFFSGMSIEETAEALGVSASSVSQQWRLARAWLKKEMENV
jgi:RNA polymerase sigma factor, TIGR02999 family